MPVMFGCRGRRITPLLPPCRTFAIDTHRFILAGDRLLAGHFFDSGGFNGRFFPPRGQLAPQHLLEAYRRLI
ncbi:MAG: hypothetical protein KBA15_02585 [Spirochaetes bacterium]|nr:hypothetical protein [Spirochaetota bacterium]